MQYLIICSILALILIFLPAKQWLIIGLSCIILILINLLPWYLPQLNSNDAGDTSLRVMIFNTRSPQNRNYAELLSWVKTTQPNLLALVEVDRNWFREFSQLEELYPYSFADLTSSPRGLVIYSQYPLNFAQVKYFSERDNPTLIAQITLGQPITVIATHPKPPRTTANSCFAISSLRALVATYKPCLIPLLFWAISTLLCGLPIIVSLNVSLG